MLTKTCPVLVKALVTEGDDAGQFEALVAVFGNKDSYGDVIIPGAFEDSLAEWAAKGIPIPIYWSHQLSDPDMNIGWVLEAKETAEGLWIKGQLDLEAAKGVVVYRLFKGRRVTQFSFSYDLEEYAWSKSEEHGDYLELRKVKVHEVGPTPVGANQSTDLIDVKSAAMHADRLNLEVKAGRKISAKNEETLRSAYTAIGEVLSSIESDESKASVTVPAKDETPAGKSEEPTPESSAIMLDILEAELALLV